MCCCPYYMCEIRRTKQLLQTTTTEEHWVTFITYGVNLFLSQGTWLLCVKSIMLDIMKKEKIIIGKKQIFCSRCLEIENIFFAIFAIVKSGGNWYLRYHVAIIIILNNNLFWQNTQKREWLLIFLFIALLTLCLVNGKILTFLFTIVNEDGTKQVACRCSQKYEIEKIFVH